MQGIRSFFGSKFWVRTIVETVVFILCFFIHTTLTTNVYIMKRVYNVCIMKKKYICFCILINGEYFYLFSSIDTKVFGIHLIPILKYF